MRIDISFLPALAAAFMLVFARIGAMLMLLPGLGELMISARLRLTTALVLAAVMLPLHRDAYQVDLHQIGPVMLMLAEELLIGAVLGMTARLTIAALQVTGSVVAQQLGLGFVTAVDPTQGQQGVILGNFLTILGIWKLLGFVALVIPRFPRLKEWAYAGVLFDLTGAVASLWASGLIGSKFLSFFVKMYSGALSHFSR